MDVLSDFADCAASLHEAALSPESWPAALAASLRLFGASGMVLTDIDTRRGSPRSIQTGGHDPALLAAYAGHYQSIDPTITVGMAGAHGTVYHLRDHFSERQMAHSEYFQEFLFAFGVGDVMATPIDYAPGARLFASFQRRIGDEPFDATSHPLLERYIRQIHIAKQTEARLRTSLSAQQALAAGLDAFAEAVFIVDAKVRLRHRNRSADGLLQSIPGIRIRSGALELRPSSADARLQHAVRSAARVNGAGEAFPATLEGASGNEARQQILVVPLHPAHPLNSSWEEPLVLVIVSDARQFAANGTQRLSRLHGLTAAEGRLVAELLEGKTLQEIAHARAVAMATLRTQLKSVFGKTGTSRQVDLVRLVAALSPFVREGSTYACRRP